MILDELSEITAEPRNILFLSPSFHRPSEIACIDLLTARSHARTGVLMVTNVSMADECLRHWTTHADEWPAKLKLITAGEFTRSAAVRRVSSSVTADIDVGTISSPGDLTGVGIEVTEQLSAWREENLDIVACIDSLTVLFQYASTERVYEFLYVLTRQMADADVVAHYHLDPGAHDEETEYIVRSLFDTVIEFDGDEVDVIPSRVRLDE